MLEDDENISSDDMRYLSHHNENKNMAGRSALNRPAVGSIASCGVIIFISPH